MNISEINEKSGEFCKYWLVTSAGCEAAVVTSPWCCHHPPLTRLSVPLWRSNRRHVNMGAPGAHVSGHNKRQHWELLSLIYGEKIWAGPPGPVSPCHRQSVNTVLGSEEQNLFYPPGRQCQCFHLDLSPQRDHLTLTKVLPFRSQIIWSAWIHKEGWVVHKVFNLPNNQVSTVIVWVRNSLTQSDKKLMFILSTLIAWHLFGTVQIFMIWDWLTIPRNWLKYYDHINRNCINHELRRIFARSLIFNFQAYNKSASSLTLDMDRLRLNERRRPLTSGLSLSRQIRGSSTGSSLSSLSPDDERPRPITSRTPRSRPIQRPTNPQTQKLNTNDLARLTGNRPTKVIESSSEWPF